MYYQSSHSTAADFAMLWHVLEKLTGGDKCWITSPYSFDSSRRKNKNIIGIMGKTSERWVESSLQWMLNSGNGAKCQTCRAVEARAIYISNWKLHKAQEQTAFFWEGVNDDNLLPCEAQEYLWSDSTTYFAFHPAQERKKKQCGFSDKLFWVLLQEL